MAKKKPRVNAGFVLFNVIYEDGSLSSNRKVPADVLDGLDGDEPARAIIEEQDRNIAVMSGRLPGRIKALARVGAKEKDPKQKRQSD
jgi:hypothetical protein